MAIKDSTAYLSTRSFTKKWIQGFEAEPADTIVSQLYVLTRNRIGVSNPYWRRQVASGENATTNMAAEYQAMQSKRAVVQLSYSHPSYPTYTYRVLGNGDFAATVLPHDVPNGPFMSTDFVYNLAATEFLSDCRKTYEQMQALTALGELPETLRMLEGAAHSLYRDCDGWMKTAKKIMRSVKQPRKHWREINNKLSSAWLETMFGWKPLINDINDSIGAYQDLQKRLTYPAVRQISSGKKKSFDISSTYAPKVGSTFLIASGPRYRCVRAARYERHLVRFKGAMRSQSDTPEWRDTERAYGIDVGSFIPTCWELLPWSFLVDYFVNVGDCLNSITTNTTNILYVNITVITETNTFSDWIFDDTWVPSAGWKLSSGSASPSGSILSKRVVQRGAGVGVPYPRLQFTYNLSDGQLLNCAALLAQAIDGFPQSSSRKWHR
jgi:hypothetical protein